jgi:ABC-2 type transport system permease protein
LDYFSSGVAGDGYDERFFNMVTAIKNFLADCISLNWLTGAIFDKELRVASRRRRNYVLRFGYLSLLTLALLIAWLSIVRITGSSTYAASRMSLAGQTIVTFIVWFQFCAGQIAAGIMLSNAISDEIYHKTLGILMTTPINSFQIIMGKLLSRLLQLILLLAISLPLLTIVRIFGGIPWDFLLSSLCMTLCTVIFVGLLSMFYSIFCRKAYVVIIWVILTLGIAFALFPLLTVTLWDVMNWNHIISEIKLMGLLFLPNPYANMFFNTLSFIEPRSMAGGPFFYWPVNCGIILAASGIILLLSMACVRKVALRQAAGQLIFSPGKKRPVKTAPGISGENQSSTVSIRQVKGPPILWKEKMSPVWRRHKVINTIALLGALGLPTFSYWLFHREDMLDDEDTHIAYVLVFLSLGVLYTVVIPSTTITSEKESQAWPILLTTTIENRDIISGKFIGSLRRLFGVWIILFIHLFIFMLGGIIPPIAFLQEGIVAAEVIAFLCSSGIYFSSRFKHTTTAVGMNLILAASVWALFPLLMVFISEIFDFPNDSPGICMDIHPFYQAANIIQATVNNSRSQPYYGEGLGDMNTYEYTIFLLACLTIYLFVGFMFILAAKKRLRKNIF